MKKLITSIMLGALLVVGAFTANQTTDSAMDAEPTVFSVDMEAPAGSLF